MILVVNADDAGVDEPRDAGILRAAREGIVRSASVVANAPAAAALVAEARQVEGLGVGLHLNLSQGAPLAPGGSSLVDGHGLFPGKREMWRRAVHGLLDADEALREVRAQWAALRALGVAPTHLDGHNHVHLFPGVREAVLGTLPPGSWVRCAPGEEPGGGRDRAPLPADPYEDAPAFAATFDRLSRDALDEGWGVFRHARRFAGMLLPPGYGAADLRDLLVALDDGAEAEDVIEVMTHPGIPFPRAPIPFSRSPDRGAEVEALASPAVLSLVAARGIRLASFGDLR